MRRPYRYLPLFITEQGEMMPRGCGLAWLDFAAAEIVSCPVPFNLLVGWVRALYLWVRRGHPLHDDVELSHMREAAFRAGEKAGLSAGILAGYRQIDSLLDLYPNGPILREYVSGARLPEHLQRYRPRL